MYIDSSWLLTELRCLFWRRRRTIDRSQVQFAREGEGKVTSNKYGSQSRQMQIFAEIDFTRGSFALPCNTSSERSWLIGLVNDFLKTVPYRAPVFGDERAIDPRVIDQRAG